MSEATNTASDSNAAENVSRDFIRTVVEEDLGSGHFGGRVQTRFPPEPNGYLHIGHIKAINISFSIAADYGGKTNLRFDDTNPTKEEVEYVEAIQDDIRWLGYEWENLLFASDYFQQLYEWAIVLVEAGKAYVDDLSPEAIRDYRGDWNTPGRNSPYRDLPVAENLDLLARMKAGEFPDGSRVLRAKIDMTAPNMNLRDPIMYRILHAEHHRTGTEWCIYPMYDWAHGQSDSIETITYSLCSLEFENHRPLYDWFLDQLGIHHPRQLEFARLAVNYTLTSKRKLRQLIEEGYVAGWDDPRLATVRGMRRRGYTPLALRNFVERVGVSKANSVVDMAMLEHAVREDLNMLAPRAMAVLRPLKVVITNYPEDKEEHFPVMLYMQDKTRTESREVPFSREIYIEREDFMEDAPRKFYRLSLGREVRLLGAYLVTCTDVIKNEAGEVVELHCTYDPDTRGGNAPDGRKVKGTIHWVSGRHALPAEVRLYDVLFTRENPSEVDEPGQDFTSNVNPHSLEVLSDALLEPALATAVAGDRFQFMRQGYFVKDPDSTANRPVFNLTVTLRDSWAKVK